MSKYTEGQKVFAYVVMSTQGANVLTGGEKAEGKVLIEKQGRGPSHTYNWCSDSGEMTYWLTRKAGRGFIRGESVEWDEVTKRQMAFLIEKAAA